MKNIVPLICLLTICFEFADAQPTKQQPIDESEPGWYKVYHFKATRESQKINGRLCSAAQLSICDTLANWMQASYLPKAGIGDVQRTVSPAPNQYKPLRQDFILSSDLMVPENFTWGAKGLVVMLAKEETEGVAESFIRLKIRPGSGGSDGESELETKFPSPYTSGTKWYGAPGFSNNKKLNRIHVDIRKSGEVLQFLIDKKIITEYTKGVPANMLFNGLSFSMANSGGENDLYYISNIKITKE